MEIPGEGVQANLWIGNDVDQAAALTRDIDSKIDTMQPCSISIQLNNSPESDGINTRLALGSAVV